MNTIYNVYLKEKNSSDLRYLLAIINSTAIGFFWQKNNSDEKKTFPKIKKEAILSIPVPTITDENKRLHNEIVRLVDAMIDLNKQKQQVTLPNQIEPLEQRIEHSDKKIDQLVYQLYGLTAEEIKIVESQ